VLVLLALGASSASAAFPGRDGLLAVQPVTGPGIVLVNAHGDAERRICGDSARCGFPRTPRWSPDGQILAFNASNVHLIYPDGSCLNCALAGGGTPAFTSDPALVTVESDGALVEDGIDGFRQETIMRGQFSDAVWSAQGQLAVVRHGSVWAGRPHELRLIGAGSAPSWSPGGTHLAIAQKGWVVVVGTRDHSSRRLIRGGAPAWSPDGGSIAFVGAGHRLQIVAASGGRAHPVGSLRAVNVDWQPVPKQAAPACTTPPGLTVLASGPTGIVTGEPYESGGVYMGCLRADGRERVLERFANNQDNSTTVRIAAVGGGYAALANNYDDPHYGDDSQASVAVFDLNTGAAVPDRGGQSVGCPGDTSACTAGVSQLAVGSGGVSAADLTLSFPPGAFASPLATISCASSSLCAALDSLGRVLISTDPAGGGGAWAVTEGQLDLIDISCPSASFCAGVSGRFAVTSTDPTDAGTWASAEVETGAGSSSLDAISCPSASLCVAVDSAGNVLTSTDPTAGASAWTRTNVDGTSGLGPITCPSVSLCVAINSSGDAISSSDPTGGAGAWQTAAVSGQVGPLRVSCPSTTLCVAVGALGEAFTTTDPASGTPWTPVAVPGDPDAVSCPSTSLCLAGGDAGTLDVSTDPTAGVWTSSMIDGGQSLTSLDCPSTTLCVAGDMDGDVVTSSDPTGGPAAWTAALVDGSACSDQTFCTGEDLVASDSTGEHSLDAITGPGMGTLLTALTLTGDTLTWEHAGTPESAELH
jgi:hypothetical protein